MIKYQVITDCWWRDTYWKKGQTAIFDEKVKVPEHFEKIGVIGKPKTKKNTEENKE